MHNDDGVENALENKIYSFSLFCMKNSFCFEGRIVEVDVAGFKVPTILSMSVRTPGGLINAFYRFYELLCS